MDINSRDYFATKAMQSLLIRSSVNNTNIFKRIKNFLGIGNGYSSLRYSASEVSREAYEMADEMLKNKKTNGREEKKEFSKES